MAVALLPMTGFAAVIYVDGNSSSIGADGSANHPYMTVNDAFEKMKNLPDDESAEIVVREGRYHFDKGIQLARSNVSIRAASADDLVVFSGGVDLPTEAVKRKGRKCEVNLSKLGISDFGQIRSMGFSRPFYNSWGELFVNGQPMHLAKWPNEGMVAMGKVLDAGSVPRNGDMANRGAVMQYDFDSIDSWEIDEDIWIGGYFNYGYADDMLRIARIDKAAHTITTDGATLYGFNSGNDWNKWYAFNVKEELDIPGEFYIDRHTGILSFIPYSEHLSSLTFSMLEEPFIDIHHASNITISGIRFCDSRAAMISLVDCHDVTISNCSFYNGGNVGVVVGLGIEPFKDYLHEGTGQPVRGTVGSLQQHLYANQTFNRYGGSDNTIDHCTFSNLGAGGVSLGGGDRLTLEPGNNRVINCTFHTNNRLQRSYRPAVHLTGVGNSVSNCEIYDAPSMAILIHGNNHQVAHNYIHDVCLEVEDQGAVYYGRNPSESGNCVTGNLFANIPHKFSTSAVYHDDGACGMTVINNIFFRAGRYASLIGGGSDNRYEGNLIIDMPLGIHIDNRLQNWSKGLIAPEGLFEKRLTEVGYTQPPYSDQYPWMADYLPNDSLPKRNVIQANAFVNVGAVSDNIIWLVERGNIICTDADSTALRNSCFAKLIGLCREGDFDTILKTKEIGPR